MTVARVPSAADPGRLALESRPCDGGRIVERGGNWFTRQFGAGYPDLAAVVDRLAALRAGGE